MEPKDETIQIRCSKSMKRKLKDRAAEQGIDLTKLLWLSLMAANPELATDIAKEM